MTYLGMQIMVEGLALAAFGFMHQMTDRAAAQAAAALRDERRGPPRRVRRAVAARRCTTGMSRRRDARSARSSPSRRRCACATASCSRRSGSAWASTPKDDRSRYMLSDPTRDAVPADAVLEDRAELQEARPARRNDSWLRHRFEEIGVIQFEDWVDTGEEYGEFALPEGAVAVDAVQRAEQGPLVGSRRMAHQSDPHLLRRTCPSCQGLRHRRRPRSSSPASPSRRSSRS